MPRAVELLVQEGIDEDLLVEQCRIPHELFRTVVSRRPDISPGDRISEDSQRGDERSGGRVVSLLDRGRSKIDYHHEQGEQP